MARTPNPVLKVAMIEALEKSLGVVTTACKVAGIHRRTYYLWMKNDPEFKREAEDIRNIAIDFAESKLYEAIGNGNIAAVIFYLKTKAKDRGYIERVEQYIKADRMNLPEWMIEDAILIDDNKS